jgi:hypothetical protein
MEERMNESNGGEGGEGKREGKGRGGKRMVQDIQNTAEYVAWRMRKAPTTIIILDHCFKFIVSGIDRKFNHNS